jgi:hypothetical protein
VTTDDVRELERRLRAHGLSRKASRDAVSVVRAWLAEQPPHDADLDAGVALLEAAHVLMRRLQTAR